MTKDAYCIPDHSMSISRIRVRQLTKYEANSTRRQQSMIEFVILRNNHNDTAMAYITCLDTKNK